MVYLASSHSISTVSLSFRSDSWLGLISRVVMILGSRSGPRVSTLPSFCFLIIHFVLEETEAQNYLNLKIFVPDNVVKKWWSQHLNSNIFDPGACSFDNPNIARLIWALIIEIKQWIQKSIREGPKASNVIASHKTSLWHLSTSGFFSRHLVSIHIGNCQLVLCKNLRASHPHDLLL